MKIKVPGKLYVAGEYSVVEGASSALVVPVDRFVTCEVTASDSSTLTSDFYPDQIFYFDKDYRFNSALPYIQEALFVVKRYLNEINCPLKSLNISLSSTLDSDGKKYGFGSSGAVTVALIESVIQFHGFKLTSHELFKLAVICQFEQYPYSSFGDIACSAYKKQVVYHRFDANFLQQHIHLSIKDLLDITWDELRIEPVDINLDHCLVIHTGAPSVSQSLVKSFNGYHSELFYKLFLVESHTLTNTIIKGFKAEDYETLVTAFDAHYNAFINLQRKTDIPFIIDAMTKIKEVCKTYNGGCKFSGAGGGDNVLAVFFSASDKIQAIKALKKLNYYVYNSLFWRGNNE